MKRLAVFASGRGSNFRAIQAHLKARALPGEFVLLVSDRPHPPVADYAADEGIPFLFLNRKAFNDTREYAERLLRELENGRVQWIVLAGYLKMIPEEVVAAYRHRIINIHPALLPSFGGAGMYGHYVHEAVIKAGVKVTGATVHLVDEEYDHGPIIIQATVPVHFEDTADSVAERVLKVEHQIYPEAVEWAILDKIRVQDNRVQIL